MFVFPPLEINDGRITDGQAVRNHNASLLTNLVWHHRQGISRTDLARLSGLAVSTVSTIVNDLLALDLVATDHMAPSRAGRPPAVLRFNDTRDHIVGVEMGASHVTVALCDLRANVAWHQSHDFDVPGDPPGTMRLIGQLIDQARRHPSASGSLLGVGVAVPCPVDSITPGRLSPRILPKWAEVHFAAELNHRTGARAFMDNDANCGALAEAFIGSGRGISDFTYIKVATGVGAGHIVAGAPYRGFSGIAGEIGHTRVDPHGRRCRCGLNGCLETEVGSQSIVDKAIAALGAGRESALASVKPLGLEAIVAAARAGDPLAVELIAEAGGHLGVAIANLINLMNPARVVLGGRLATAGELLLAPLRKSLLERALWTSIERSDVVISALGSEHIAVGGALLVLRAALADLGLFPEPRPAVTRLPKELPARTGTT